MAAANHLNRRLILKGASALGAAGALAALPAVEIGHAEPAYAKAHGPAGSWVAKVTTAGTGGLPPFQALRTYADGGGYVETSSTSQNENSPTGSGHGAWASTGALVAKADRRGSEARTFAVTFVVQRFDGSGNLIGSTKVRESAALDETGDAYSGSGKFEVLDLQGNLIVSGVSTVHATRIKVEPF